MTPDYDVAQVLHAAGLGLTYGTNLFTGPIRAAQGPVPLAATFCVALGGSPPEGYLNNGAATPELFSPLVRVIIRGSSQAHATELTLGRGVIAALHGKPPSTYISCRSRQSQPEPYGEDDDGAFLFGMDFDLLKDE